MNDISEFDVISFDNLQFTADISKSELVLIENNLLDVCIEEKEPINIVYECCKFCIKLTFHDKLFICIYGFMCIVILSIFMFIIIMVYKL